MKKSIILSALAGIALTASAQTAKITPAQFTPETIVAGQPIYLIEKAATDAWVSCTAPGEYLKFSNVGGSDLNTWTEYTLNFDVVDDDLAVKVRPSVAVSIGITECGTDYKPVLSVGYVPGQTITLDHEYYSYYLETQTDNGGVYYTPAQFQIINAEGQASAPVKLYMSRPAADGTFLISDYVMTEDPTTAVDFSHSPLFLAIGQKQFEYRCLVQQAMDFVETTDYVGGHFAALKAACETEGCQWEEQCVQVATLLNLFKIDVMRLNVASTRTQFGITEIDKDGNLIITGAPYDNCTVTVAGWDAANFVADTTVQLDENGKAVVPVTFFGSANDMSDFARMYTAEILVNIEGQDMEPVAVNGVNPVLSFDGDDVVRYTSVALPYNQTIEIPFQAFGYRIDGTVYENAKLPVAIAEGKDAADFSVEIVKTGETKMMGSSIENFKAIITYNSAEIDIDHANIVITDGILAANNLVVSIDAGNVDFHVVDKDFNAIERIDFPYTGGELFIGLAYDAFKGVNAWNTIKGESDNAAFKLEFFDSFDKDHQTADLEGTGIVYVKVICEPATEKGVTEGNLTFWVNDKKIVVPVTRTYPNVFRNQSSCETLTHDPIHIGGADFWNYNHEVEFILKDMVNCYSMDDLNIYTDLSVFAPTNTSRWFTWKVNEDGDVAITVNINYIPCKAHDIDHGHLFIEIPGTTLVVELWGEAGDEATVAKVKGETDGIESIAADNASNKTVYTISGARASKSTKGLVIENGVKVVK